METKELYASLVGSHAWGMDRADSDYDYWIIYQTPSRSFLLGNTHRKGHSSKSKFSDGIGWDRSSFEIGQHIRELMGGNINHVVGILAPSVPYFDLYPGKQSPPHFSLPRVSFHHQSAHTPIKMKLRELFLSNPSKNIFKSINGMSNHNINKYFVREHRSGKINPQFIPDTKENKPVRIKKLGQIRRIVEFGFRVLVSGIYDLRPVKILNGSDGELSIVRQWQEDLKHAHNMSDLPEKPDKEPYEEFLIDLRMSMLER